ncbi:MAG TPA: YSC84-related protein [Steroidobacteraceae bacterium]|jgi:lipid-binding SYLF domain-containing protein|nr:YSC84-related protein [Steroidobacteraceae bacterium]
MKRKTLFAASSFAAVALLLSAVSFGATKAEIDKRVHVAMHQFYELNPHHKDLVARARGVLVFPRITKGGVGVGGQFGEGALRIDGKTIDYYSIASASVGVTLGLARRKEVILFMSEEALDKFMTSHGWTIGADANVAVLDKGAGGDYDTQTLQRPILGFVFGEKGLIGDVSLEGSKITKIEK